MKTKTKNGKVIEKKFKLGKDFIDPLDPEGSFEEIEVEEYSYYYGIHLGVPQKKEEDETL